MAMHLIARTAGASLLTLSIGQAMAVDSTTGSIFTTSVHGWPMRVGNVNATNGAVYLAAGPTAAPECGSRLLPDGSYYFQVTDLHTKTLVSTQPLAMRRVDIQKGRIVRTAGETGAGTACGSANVPLLPWTYQPSANQLLRASLTRVADYERICGRGRDCGPRGFVPARSVSTNFQLRIDKIGVGTVEVFRFYDGDANGRYDAGEVEMPRWMVLISAPNMDRTDEIGHDGTVTFRLVPGSYSFGVTGQKESNWYTSATLIDGRAWFGPGAPDVAVKSGKTTVVASGAYCTVPAGRSLDYWLSDGAGLIDTTDLQALRALPLVQPNGERFSPTTTQELSTWLTSWPVSNWSFHLSRYLALARLNVRHGLTDPATMIYPVKRTVETLMAEAAQMVMEHPLVTGTDPKADAYLTQLRWMQGLADEVDEGGSVGKLSPKPCPFTPVW